MQHVVLFGHLAPRGQYQLVIGSVVPGPRPGTHRWVARGYFLSYERGRRRVGERRFIPPATAALVTWQPKGTLSLLVTPDFIRNRGT